MKTTQLFSFIMPKRRKNSFDKNWKVLCSTKLNKSSNKIDQPKNTCSHSKSKNEIWFDDVDPILLEVEERTSQNPTQTLESADSLKLDNPSKDLTKCLAIDCEMVGVGTDGKENILARVSIVNQFGNCVYDHYVLPTETVTDYRTAVSGVTKKILFKKGIPFSEVQRDVSELLENRILIGHALHNDLAVLLLSHPRKAIRDTSQYKYFRSLFNGGTPSLKRLTAKVLNVAVQDGSHDSVEDARAAMRIYTLHRRRWERDIKNSNAGRVLASKKDGKDDKSRAWRKRKKQLANRT